MKRKENESLEQYLKRFIEHQIKYAEEDGSTTFATCDARYWDQDIYNHRHEIANAIRERGYNVEMARNYGVTDVTITKKLNLS